METMSTLIVTGASRGIGAAIARLAGQRGYAVAVNFNSGAAEAKKVAADIVAAGGHAIPIHADISSEDQILTLFQTAERELGPIKGLVNNAGVAGGFARVENVTAESLLLIVSSSARRQRRSRRHSRSTSRERCSVRARRCAACRQNEVDPAGQS